MSNRSTDLREAAGVLRQAMPLTDAECSAVKAKLGALLSEEESTLGAAVRAVLEKENPVLTDALVLYLGMLANQRELLAACQALRAIPIWAQNEAQAAYHTLEEGLCIALVQAAMRRSATQSWLRA